MTGAYTVCLAEDMRTVISQPKLVVPTKTNGTPFEGHAFFEAASIRKLKGRYYFIYSSRNNHELCYAISEKPDEGFAYGGTIVSNGDIGYQGREPGARANLTGNNHGSIEKINGKYYIFNILMGIRHNKSPCWIFTILLQEDVYAEGKPSGENDPSFTNVINNLLHYYREQKHML